MPVFSSRPSDGSIQLLQWKLEELTHAHHLVLVQPLLDMLLDATDAIWNAKIQVDSRGNNNSRCQSSYVMHLAVVTLHLLL